MQEVICFQVAGAMIGDMVREAKERINNYLRYGIDQDNRAIARYLERRVSEGYIITEKPMYKICEGGISSTFSPTINGMQYLVHTIVCEPYSEGE